MAVNPLRYHFRMFVILGMLIGMFIGIPVCFAGGAVTIVQDKRVLAPRGSYIPERRVQQILKKVREHKEIIKKEDMEKGENQLELEKTDKPDAP